MFDKGWMTRNLANYIFWQVCGTCGWKCQKDIREYNRHLYHHMNGLSFDNQQRGVLPDLAIIIEGNLIIFR